jgi:hypothetical protein
MEQADFVLPRTPQAVVLKISKKMCALKFQKIPKILHVEVHLATCKKF